METAARKTIKNMNHSQIYTAQEILSRHDALRDELHSCIIIPDDQRIISDLHAKICLFITRGVAVDMKEYETIFENLRVIFAEYDQNDSIQAYLDGCFALIVTAIDMFNTKNTDIATMVYYNNCD